jgi:hypothetical protein
MDEKDIGICIGIPRSGVLPGPVSPRSSPDSSFISVENLVKNYMLTKKLDCSKKERN